MPVPTEIVGIAAGICTGIAMLPQLIKIIREKKAEDISFVMLLVLIVGLGGWVWYGLLREDYPIIITNAFSLLVNFAIVYFSYRYRQKKN